MDSKYMSAAIELARKGVECGDGGPFGAVIVKDGQIVGRGWNRVVGRNDPTAHAEMEAIRDAAQHLGQFHLEGCQLFSSCEPCPMCLSAAYWAHIEQIYFAASEQDAAEIGFDDRFIGEELSKPPRDRTIKARQIQREEALEVFAQWRESTIKRPY